MQYICNYYLHYYLHNKDIETYQNNTIINTKDDISEKVTCIINNLPDVDDILINNTLLNKIPEEVKYTVKNDLI